ncbi:hypothetical protein C8R43DRAFT_1156271 [Mycena crocata]|nr:hypothetical protein C8R43DRAFT_1156271 [Mycena crocata]
MARLRLLPVMLPEELIDDIVKRTPPSELLEFCRADRRMYRISIHHLYDTVNLKRPDALITFCEALVQRPMLSELVVALNIDFREYTRTAQNPARTNPLNNRRVRQQCATALSTLRNLTELSTLHATHLLPLLPPFRVLESFRASFSHDIGAFLRAHPLLVAVHIGTLGRATHARVQIPPVHLPLLNTFLGPEVVARAVLPGSFVADPVIFWDAPAQRRMPAPACLARVIRARTPIIELSSILQGWCSQPDPRDLWVVDSTLEVLKLRSTVHSAEVDQVAFLDALTQAVAGFERLTTLMLIEPPHPRRPLGDATFDNEWELLQLWHGLCPTLAACQMLSGIRWERLPQNPVSWVPVNTPERVQPSPEFTSWMQRRESTNGNAMEID